MSGGRTRLHYLDWLRALAVLGVFVYHTAQPFSTEDWHIKNADVSEAIQIPIGFLRHMGNRILLPGVGGGSVPRARVAEPSAVPP